MKSIRLNNSIRRAIEELVICEVFKEREERLKELNYELGDIVYSNRYTKEVTEYIENAPEEIRSLFFTTSKGIMVYIDGQNLIFPLKSPRLIFFFDNFNAPYYYSGYVQKFSVDSEVEKFYSEKIVSLKDEMNADREGLRYSLRSTLDSANTSKQLVNIWPESERYIEKVMPEDSNLPCLVSKDLQDLIIKLSSK